ncbi:MAG: carbohydrate porin [Betaproteobacteria bacterium]|nr:carbohydrate porin [Betaproteobacteria bacterium]
MPPFKHKYLAVALAGVMLAGAAPTFAADLSQAELMKELRRLSERMEKLEARNIELERKAQTPPAKSEAELAQRIKALEENNAKMEAALDSDRLSEKDPEVVTRLKDIEIRTLSMQKQARAIESLEGITAGASLTMVAQSANKSAVAAGNASSALNYRGDVSVTLPGGSIGNAEGKIFTQFRLGQGSGLALNNTLSSTPNTTAFQLTNPNDSTAMLAQAWYQMDIPLPLGGHKPNSREHMEVNVGKIDPFVFFDQNSAADDESSKFLNNAFVHNPLLDSGGGAGVDAYGFTPGVRLAYHNETGKPEWWRASLGVFGAGSGAGYNRTFSSPFVIGQLEFGRKSFGGLDGTYRLYAWRNGQSKAYQNESDTAVELHAGWGASIDQRVGDATTVFGRYGKSLNGNVRFDQALTLGAEFGGNYWSRGADGVGVALGWLRTSKDFRDNSSALDVNADGTADFGYAASGAEQLAEIYYRMRLNKNLELTPDFQLVRQPGGDNTASTAKVIGLRAKASF